MSHGIQQDRLFDQAEIDGQIRQRAPARVSLLASPLLGGLLDPVIAHLAATDPDLFGDLALDVARIPWEDGAAPLEALEEARMLDQVLPDARPAAVRILFTTQRFSDNWFSHWHESRQAAVVSLAGWGGPSTVPAEAFVAYEILLHGLRTLGAAWSPEHLTHAETRGCLFDFCAHREDVDIKLQAADFCPSCHDALRANGIPMDRVQRLAEVVKTLAVPAGVVH